MQEPTYILWEILVTYFKNWLVEILFLCVKAYELYVSCIFMCPLLRMPDGCL